MYFDSTTSSAGVPTLKAREIAVMLSKPLLFAMLTLVGYIIFQFKFTNDKNTKFAKSILQYAVVSIAL